MSERRPQGAVSTSRVEHAGASGGGGGGGTQVSNTNSNTSVPSTDENHS